MARTKASEMKRKQLRWSRKTGSSSPNKRRKRPIDSNGYGRAESPGLQGEEEGQADKNLASDWPKVGNDKAGAMARARRGRRVGQESKLDETQDDQDQDESEEEDEEEAFDFNALGGAKSVPALAARISKVDKAVRIPFDQGRDFLTPHHTKYQRSLLRLPNKSYNGYRKQSNFELSHKSNFEFSPKSTASTGGADGEDDLKSALEKLRKTAQGPQQMEWLDGTKSDKISQNHLEILLSLDSDRIEKIRKEEEKEGREVQLWGKIAQQQQSTSAPRASANQSLSPRFSTWSTLGLDETSFASQSNSLTSSVEEKQRSKRRKSQLPLKLHETEPSSTTHISKPSFPIQASRSYNRSKRFLSPLHQFEEEQNLHGDPSVTGDGEGCELPFRQDLTDPQARAPACTSLSSSSLRNDSNTEPREVSNDSIDLLSFSHTTYTSRDEGFVSIAPRTPITEPILEASDHKSRSLKGVKPRSLPTRRNPSRKKRELSSGSGQLIATNRASGSSLTLSSNKQTNSSRKGKMKVPKEEMEPSIWHSTPPLAKRRANHDFASPFGQRDGLDTEQVDEGEESSHSELSELSEISKESIIPVQTLSRERPAPDSEPDLSDLTDLVEGEGEAEGEAGSDSDLTNLTDLETQLIFIREQLGEVERSRSQSSASIPSGKSVNSSRSSRELKSLSRSQNENQTTEDTPLSKGRPLRKVNSIPISYAPVSTKDGREIKIKQPLAARDRTSSF